MSPVSITCGFCSLSLTNHILKANCLWGARLLNNWPSSACSDGSLKLSQVPWRVIRAIKKGTLHLWRLIVFFPDRDLKPPPRQATSAEVYTFPIAWKRIPSAWEQHRRFGCLFDQLRHMARRSPHENHTWPSWHCGILVQVLPGHVRVPQGIVLGRFFCNSCWRYPTCAHECFTRILDLVIAIE